MLFRSYTGCNNGLIVDDQIILSTSRNSLVNRGNIDSLLELHNTNNPSGLSLMSGSFDIEVEQWYIRDPIYNPVLSLYDFGSPDFCTLLTEDNIDLLSSESEEPDYILSNNEKDHGSRVILDNSYEILDSKYAVKDNGKILVNSVFEDLICENEEKLVHDYAIASRAGHLTILYPGHRQNYTTLTFPKIEYHRFLTENEELFNDEIGNILTTESHKISYDFSYARVS